MNQIIELKLSFEDVFKFKLDIDKNVQDASFTADLGLLDDNYFDRVKGTGVIIYHFSFRFSNFGNLYTLINPPSEKSKYYKEILHCQMILKNTGFIFIDANELDELYDGLNQPFEPGLTWWTRYFDYL
jgi:hypothetical protein